MRLSRLENRHVRGAEILRFLDIKGGVAVLPSIELARELASRNVIDMLKYTERYRGAERLNGSGRSILWISIQLMEDLGLIERFRPGEFGRRRAFMLTKEGRDEMREFFSP